VAGLILFGADSGERSPADNRRNRARRWLVSAATQHLPPLGALGMMLLAAMALTLFSTMRPRSW
jgi:hypothetical protein